MAVAWECGSGRDKEACSALCTRVTGVLRCPSSSGTKVALRGSCSRWLKLASAKAISLHAEEQNQTCSQSSANNQLVVSESAWLRFG